jgi:hypothetical protein
MTCCERHELGRRRAGDPLGAVGGRPVPLGQVRWQVDAAAVVLGEVHGRLGALVLQGLRQRDRLLPEPRELRGLREPVRLAHGGRHLQPAEDQPHEDGQHDNGEQPPRHRPVRQGDRARSPAGPAATTRRRVRA